MLNFIAISYEIKKQRKMRAQLAEKFKTFYQYTVGANCVRPQETAGLPYGYEKFANL